MGGEGGDIQWVVADHVHERWVDCFAQRRETHTEKEREMSHGEKKEKKRNYK